MSLSRQNTVRQSHRRKNSMTASLNLQGRRSPCGTAPEQRSPQGRRSPVFLSYEQSRSGHRSPTDRRSPTSSIHVQQQSGHRSPIDYEKRSPISGVAPPLDRKMSGGISPDERRTSLQQSLILGRRSPIGFSQGMMIPLTPSRSPTLPIPPITISNPSETIAIIQRQIDSTVESSADEKSPPPVERKEKTSVMREILAFVRKPSKKVTTRTSRFAAAFSRAESTSGSPLLRQSTFSSAPTASSRAAKSAVTKQMSEVSLEPKMSQRFKNLAYTTKLSLRLRRSDTGSKGKDMKKSSGEEASDVESITDVRAVEKLGTKPSLSSTNGGLSFELENVYFEKVGDSYIKHEQIREETLEESSPVKSVSSGEKRTAEGTLEPQRIGMSGKSPLEEETERIEELKRSLLSLLPPVEGSVDDATQDTTEAVPEFTLEKPQVPATTKMQCPTFEIEPPSRRASFDPPRSPYLENLRSPGARGDDASGVRRDSGADSFEIVDTDRNRESSFEDRYSSIDTSFDISRYHSTSYEDQTSSFEMMEATPGDKRSPYDLRKSSIELVDVETFQQRSGGSSDGRKSSLETHFDYTLPHGMAKHFHSRKHYHQQRAAMPRPRSPLSQQTSSNYSSRDSYDSASEPLAQKRLSGSRSPFADPTRQHFPLPARSPCTGVDGEPFLCMDHRCAAIFEPRPPRTSSPYLTTSSGSEFEPPSPRRASSVSPKHTFTFRIVLKKVESSPDDLCPTREPRRSRVDRHKRRDSRRKRLMDTGKSF
ncbi:serine-enriched protein-like [Phlebotomus papatasi]|nr:serine-enriched protein-like [Phlebotomus papatasi]